MKSPVSSFIGQPLFCFREMSINFSYWEWNPCFWGSFHSNFIRDWPSLSLSVSIFFCTSPFVLVACCGSPFINLGNDTTSVVQQSPEPDRILCHSIKQDGNQGQPLAIGNGSPKSSWVCFIRENAVNNDCTIDSGAIKKWKLVGENCQSRGVWGKM